MTVHTMPWTSNGIGDGPALGHGVELARRMFRKLWLTDPTLQGVCYTSEDNKFAMTHSTVSEIDVATGSALVYGGFLNSDAVATLTLTGVAADTAGIVVIGIDWTGGITGTAQTGFVREVQAGSGSTSYPTPTQTDLTSWEIEIGRYIVDSSGNVWTDTSKTTAGILDTRNYVNAGIMKGFMPMTGGYTTSGTSVILADSGETLAAATFVVPADYISGMDIYVGLVPAGSGDLKAEITSTYLRCGATAQTLEDIAYATYAVTINELSCMLNVTGTAALQAGDLVNIIIGRDADDVADTVNATVTVYGFFYEYLGYYGALPA